MSGPGAVQLPPREPDTFLRFIVFIVKGEPPGAGQMVVHHHPEVLGSSVFYGDGEVFEGQSVLGRKSSSVLFR